jgi:predicted Fe-S protein YdhL (DUF1289 family)|tara:strand:- start:1480 stop:1737 length:258 start_codon:yes stop_codon:yes gene_type:complete
MIISPCVSICKTDPVSGYCYGCGRTNHEKKIWKNEKTSDNWKENNLKIIIIRLKGWQLESFRESYNHKITHGLSLFKKDLLKKKL